ncbi:hypothetical protein ACFL6M_08085 [Candidatus Eisenbacteria bacterium]|uniref:2-C-methyl-D-erythritol 2,4-cyclodiphosphate synthase n=1 Tax=Eiseniibacteriota bacterium TaxID=2212470 RepID=A0ABV6YMH0_UNCEI
MHDFGGGGQAGGLTGAVKERAFIRIGHGVDACGFDHAEMHGHDPGSLV